MSQSKNDQFFVLSSLLLACWLVSLSFSIPSSSSSCPANPFLYVISGLHWPPFLFNISFACSSRNAKLQEKNISKITLTYKLLCFVNLSFQEFRSKFWDWRSNWRSLSVLLLKGSLELCFPQRKTTWGNISNTRDSVWPHFQTQQFYKTKDSQILDNLEFCCINSHT